MIVIQSSNNDASTCDVIDWLIYYNQKHIRINDNNVISNFIYSKKVKSFYVKKINGKKEKIDLKKIKSYWYRRGFSKIQRPHFVSGTYDYVSSLNDYFSKENYIVESLTYYIFDKIAKNKIGHIRFNEINKLVVLESAQDIGIKTPDTVLISNKKELQKFHLKHQISGIITKGINQSFGMFDKKNGVAIAAFTSLFSSKEIENCPDKFYPTLFQNVIPKKFEIRVFYLNGCFFANAIFSQNDDMTRIDFRNYNHINPNRTPPINLPNEIKKRIKTLMKKMQLNSGSIDMIYNTNGEYVFLEVNPVGQFWQVSYPCNYYLEREIAKALSI